MIDIWKEFLEEVVCMYEGEKIITIFLVYLIFFIIIMGFYSNFFLGVFEIFLFFFIAPCIVHILNEYC